MKNKTPELIHLNANENYFGCSPEVFRVIKKDIRHVYQYPPVSVRLEKKLAEKFDRIPESIIVGAGSVRLIDGIIQSFVNPDDEIIIFERSFVAYEQLAISHQRKYFLARQTNLTCDIENIFPLITDKTRVIFIANPNNPTGTIITHLQMERLLRKVSSDVLVVIDEAYCEYVSDESFPDTLSLQRKYPNIIILRTFSKIYGLAGLRIGFAIADEEIARALKKGRIPFFLNSLSEDAALAALEDEPFIKKCSKSNIREREYLFSNLRKAGYNTLETQANFLYLLFNDDEQKEKSFQQLLREGLLVCNMKVFGYDKSLRITVGDREISRRVVGCLASR